jgi:hypothetical protein
VSIGREIHKIVKQPGQMDSTLGQPGGHRDASGFQLGAELLVRGGVGAVLADPLGGVFAGGPVPDRGHHLLQSAGVVLEFGQQGELVEGELAG